MSTVLIFLIVIVILVVAHELGHFFVAKSFGVRVDEFGVGYPPRAKKLFRWKGTLFTLNWLPFGGFVKIFGEELEGQDTTDSFAHKILWKRILVIAAGILANVFFAMVLYVISFSVGFLGSVNDFPNASVITPSQVLVTSVVKDSPAQSAGLQEGDAIVVLSSGTDTTEPKQAADVSTFVKKHPTEPLTIYISRKGVLKTLSATPHVSASGTAGIGISIVEAAKLKFSFPRAVGMGVTYTVQQFGAIVSSLCTLIGGAFTGNNELLTQVSGPVGIAKFAGNAYALGFGSFMAFMALISVNLAVINLLPFPTLDGGRIILELFSKNGTSRIPQRVVSLINQIGFLILILLMLFVTYRDIAQLFA